MIIKNKEKTEDRRSLQRSGTLIIKNKGVAPLEPWELRRILFYKGAAPMEPWELEIIV